MASLRLLLPRMAAASSHCLRLVGYSLPVSECFTLELVIRMTRPGSVNGTAVASKDLESIANKSGVKNQERFYSVYIIANFGGACWDTHRLCRGGSLR